MYRHNFAKLSTQKRPSFFPVLLTAFIDLVGITLIFPIMAPLLIDNETHIFPPEYDEALRDIIYGFLIATFPIAQFFGAPILGALSDRFGRKPILLISISGAFLGYILFGIAIVMNNLPLLFIARIIPGFMGGNIAVIFSAVSDLSKVEERAKNFGLIGMAFGLGFILGPSLGGVLSDPNVVSWFSYDTPLWATAILSLFNLILIWKIFPETIKQKQKTPFGLGAGFRNISLAFSFPNLRWILISQFLVTLGFAFFTQYFQVFLIKKFEFDVRSIGMFFGYIGVWIAIAQGLIVRFISGKVKAEILVSIFIFTLGCSLPLLLVPNQWQYLLAIVPLIALSQGIQAPNLTATISIQATKEQQGSILGINQSMQSLGLALPSILGGFLSSLNYNYPIQASAIFIFIAWGVFQLFRLSKGPKEKAQLN